MKVNRYKIPIIICISHRDEKYSIGNKQMNKQENLNPWPKIFQTLKICGNKEFGEVAAGVTVFAKNSNRNKLSIMKIFTRHKENCSTSRRCT